ncbi:MAG: glycosyltransferase, partial [Candidatus Brocadiae bacterium]|nr:glycosyltransferase [Candidatus Brocadiia bacterium]
MRAAPKVTVLTPTYNRAAYLPDAIRSVLGQELADWEMLVINDGGVDVREAVEGFGDERLRYFGRDRNCGKAACLNFGLQHARGEYIAYLDDDDVWYPTHLATLARVLDENPGVGVAYSDLYKVICLPGEGGRRYPLEKRVDVCRDYNRMFMFYFNHTLHVSLMHRKDLAAAIGGYDEDVRVLIDWDLTRKLSFYTDFQHVQAVTGEYYVPIKKSDRISDVQRKDQESYLHNLRRIRADLPPEPWPKVEKLAVVFPVRRWNDRTLRIVRYFTDMLNYPSIIVLVNRDAGRSEGECRRLLGAIGELKNICIMSAEADAGLHESYLAGARRVEAAYYYLPSERLCLQVELRLIEGISYMSETPCQGVRWPADGRQGWPYDVLLRREALLACPDQPPMDWSGVHVLAEDWIPSALETDYLLQFARNCQGDGDYRGMR